MLKNRWSSAAKLKKHYFELISIPSSTGFSFLIIIVASATLICYQKYAPLILSNIQNVKMLMRGCVGPP